MKTDREELFAALEPPPGGAERLRRRMHAPERGAAGPRWRFAVATAVVAGLAVVIARWQPEPAAPSPEMAELSELMASHRLDHLLGRDFDPVAVRVRRGSEEATVVEVESTDPKVRIYEIL